MLSLIVEAPWGHYGHPGVAATLSTVPTYPIAPPSTVLGFLEAICCDELGALSASGSSMAYGWIKRPSGKGTLLGLNHVRLSDRGVGGRVAVGQRPVHRERLYNMIYRIVVQGSYAERIPKGLAGELGVDEGAGIYLGISDDVVSRIAEGEAETEWLVPGHSLWLPTRVPPKEGFASYSNWQQIGRASCRERV